MRISKLRLIEVGVFDNEPIVFRPCAKSDCAEIHILTGPNGSGKTTVLLALAETFSASLEVGGVPMETTGDDALRILSANQNEGLAKRFRYLSRSKKLPPKVGSLIKVEFDNGEGVQVFLDNFGYLTSDASSARTIAAYKAMVSYKKVEGYIATFAALSYSGYRYLNAQKAQIQEIEDNPLFGALDFIKDSNNNRFHQWLVTSLSKMAWEERKNGHKAAKFAAAISAAETAISDITGWAVKFDMETDPLALVLNINGKKFGFDVLPDGLRSLISWMGDLLMRVDSLKWQDDLPAFEKNLILFLDEIEVHLHPAWQRKVLPVVQKLFKNSQIFLSTHSPFVVNSVDGAWVYELDFKENGSAFVREVSESKSSRSYETVLQEDFGIDELFGDPTENQLDTLRRQKEAILQGQAVDEEEFLNRARHLALQGADLQVIVQYDLRHLSRVTGKNYHL